MEGRGRPPRLEGVKGQRRGQEGVKVLQWGQEVAMVRNETEGATGRYQIVMSKKSARTSLIAC